MSTILKILQISKEARTAILYDTYATWCMTHTPNAKQLQMSLTSQPLFNYFVAHYKELEQQFIIHKQLYCVNWDKKKKLELYLKFIDEIYRKYPQTLLPKIKAKEKELANQCLN